MCVLITPAAVLAAAFKYNRYGSMAWYNIPREALLFALEINGYNNQPKAV